MNKIKATITAIFTAVFSWLGILAIPVFLLVCCNLIDYATGLAAAKYRNPEDAKPIKSYLSIRGIYRKVGMYLLVIIGFFVDIMINAGLAITPYDIKIPYIVSTAVACWLVFNEMISIIENLEDIGVKIPPFFKPLVKLMRAKVEDENKVKIETDEEKKDTKSEEKT